MAEGHDHVSETRRLQLEAAQRRAAAIQARLSVGHTFCKMVDTELQYGRVDVAAPLLQKVRHIADTVSRHPDEPNHVPLAQIETLRDELEQFELQVLRLEQRFTGDGRPRITHQTL
jgi:hypothetical protein